MQFVSPCWSCVARVWSGTKKLPNVHLYGCCLRWEPLQCISFIGRKRGSRCGGTLQGWSRRQIKVFHRTTLLVHRIINFVDVFLCSSQVHNFSLI
jgi:hypothetical protein